MKEVEISKRLRAISDYEWKAVLQKCYCHVELRIGNKTSTGAHCEQRLGMPAVDFYVINALKAIYEHSWEWQFEKYDIATQLIRIINSMISNEVRKFRSARRENIQLPLLMDRDIFDSFIDDNPDENVLESEYLKECSHALARACEGNPKYTQFVNLRTQGKSYEEICEMLPCSRDEAYQIMENIARKARKLLTEKTNK